MVNRQTQSALVIGLAVSMEMRRLHHPAHQHQGDAEDAKPNGPSWPECREGGAHAADLTIAGRAGKHQTRARPPRSPRMAPPPRFRLLSPKPFHSETPAYLPPNALIILQVAFRHCAPALRILLPPLQLPDSRNTGAGKAMPR